MAASPAPAGVYFATVLDETKARLVEAGVEVFDFGVGDPTEPTPPFIRQALVEALDPVSQYPTIVGQKALREAVTRWASRRLGVTLDPATQVLPAAGSKEAIFHLALALLPPDERRRTVIYPTPCYPVYEAGARFANGVPYPVTLREINGFQLDLAEVPEDVLSRTRIAWINYPHNPTGAGVDLEYLRRQVDIARSHDILLCADDCYLDLYFDEASPPPSILQVTTTGVLSFGSLSKRSGMTGYRSGYMAGDADVIAALKKARPNFGVASPNFIQAAAVAAWSDDAHVAERRAIFRAKRDSLLGFLTRGGYQVTPGAGGIYLWARVPSPNPEAFFKAALDRGIVLSPGESFGAGGEGYFRAALVPSLDRIERAIEVWETIPV